MRGARAAMPPFEWSVKLPTEEQQAEEQQARRTSARLAVPPTWLPTIARARARAAQAVVAKTPPALWQPTASPSPRMMPQSVHIGLFNDRERPHSARAAVVSLHSLIAWCRAVCEHQPRQVARCASCSPTQVLWQGPTPVPPLSLSSASSRPQSPRPPSRPQSARQTPPLGSPRRGREFVRVHSPANVSPGFAHLLRHRDHQRFELVRDIVRMSWLPPAC